MDAHEKQPEHARNACRKLDIKFTSKENGCCQVGRFAWKNIMTIFRAIVGIYER